VFDAAPEAVHHARVSGRVKVAGAVLGFVGLVGASTLAAVTALHVTLEHGHSHDPENLEQGHHHPGTVAHHGPTVPDHGHAHQAEAPEHDHALVLVARVERPSGQAWHSLPVLGNVLATAPPDREAPSRAAARICHAGPPARAAPLCRRSVVLQV
jgi:hypothetical protein